MSNKIKSTELIWPNKKTKVKRVSLPFQTVETLSEPRLKQKRLKINDLPKNYPDDWKNRLIWGDNKFVMSSLLQQGFAGEIDLIYIDPPFATGSDFSVKLSVGGEEFTKEPSVIEELAYRDTWGEGLKSYLQMMYERLVLMKELLSETGSIYVHLDYRVVHYVKILMDEIFGRDNFRNDIVWHYFMGGKSKNFFGRKHDNILFYTKSDSWNFKPTKTKRRLDYKPSLPSRSSSGKKVKDTTGKDKFGYYSIVTRDDVWDISSVFNLSNEYTAFPTQKPEELIKLILESSSKKGDLVADFFCGSGTTGAVAEKLGRRWIMSDLSKFAIHTTRKRLLDIHNYSKDYEKPCRPFIVQNLGSYQKYKFVQNGHPPIEKYRDFILELYGSQSIKGHAFIHGKKGNNFIHVAGVDSVVTKQEIEDAAQECKNEVRGKVLDILGWDYELGLDKAVKDIEEVYNIKINLKIIPKEAAELKKASDGGNEIKFFDMSYLKVNHKLKGNKLGIELKDFVLANPEFIPKKIREKLHKKGDFSDYIDYWAVDFDYKEDTFHNMWQSFRTKREPKLSTTALHNYKEKGKKKVFVKVIDMFGNDTNKLFEVKV